MQEEWVVLEDNRYQVSNFGRVKSPQKRDVYYGSNDSTGYRTLTFNGKTHSVHQLVAINFIPNPEMKPDVNHIDSDKTNNHISNLEWVTKSENSIHTVESGTHCSNNRLTNENIILIKQMLLENISHREIAKYVNVTRPCISLMATGKRWVCVKVPNENSEIWKSNDLKIQELIMKLEKVKSEEIEKRKLSGSWKFEPEDILEIKRLLLKGYRPTMICKLYNVTSNCISSIKTGRNWSDIKLDEQEIQDILSSLTEKDIKRNSKER